MTFDEKRSAIQIGNRFSRRCVVWRKRLTKLRRSGADELLAGAALVVVVTVPCLRGDNDTAERAIVDFIPITGPPIAAIISIAAIVAAGLVIVRATQDRRRIPTSGRSI
jgi:type IV secretory pathway VirB2 component (pilin)